MFNTRISQTVYRDLVVSVALYVKQRAEAARLAEGAQSDAEEMRATVYMTRANQGLEALYGFAYRLGIESQDLHLEAWRYLYEREGLLPDPLIDDLDFDPADL